MGKVRGIYSLLRSIRTHFKTRCKYYTKEEKEFIYNYLLELDNFLLIKGIKLYQLSGKK